MPDTFGVFRALRIPVIANGNVRELADAERCLAETGCDGIMSGCGVLADPALFWPAAVEKAAVNCALSSWQGARPSRVECALLYCEHYALQYCAHDKAIVKHLQSILGKAWLGTHSDVRELIVKYRGEPEKSESVEISDSCVVETEAPATNVVAVVGSLAEIIEAVRRAATK
jgi:tRNA-dihydrouridine synthase